MRTALLQIHDTVIQPPFVCVEPYGSATTTISRLLGSDLLYHVPMFASSINSCPTEARPVQ